MRQVPARQDREILDRQAGEREARTARRDLEVLARGVQFDLRAGYHHEESATNPSDRGLAGSLITDTRTRSLAAYEVTEDGPSVLVETVPFGLLIFGGFYGAWIAVSLWFLAGARNGR